LSQRAKYEYIITTIDNNLARNLRGTLFIVNPASARGATLKTWADAKKRLTALGIDYDEHLTAGNGEAIEVTRESLNSGIDRVIAVGGDGTLSEVVNGYFDYHGKVVNPTAAIGLLPSGTGSDFHRSLGRLDSISALTSDETRSIDAAHAEFTDLDGDRKFRVFINVASFGLGGEVSALVNRWRRTLPRWIGGGARFAAAAIAALHRYRNVPISIQLDGREIQITSNLIVVANGKFAGGGMMLAPHAELDDGMLDVILTDNATRLDVVRELPRIRRGAYLTNPKVSELRARDVSIVSETPLPIDLDGEMVGYTPARIQVLPAAIRFLSADAADERR
jgi:YegS/Rv2252/BmrU family lipid kinase